MTKGKVLLWADNRLEGQIITSFLEAADFLVTSMVDTAVTREARPFDIGVIIIDHSDSNLAELIRDLRERAEDQNLRIVAVVPTRPNEAYGNSNLLVRPIRLFELAGVIQETLNS